VVPELIRVTQQIALHREVKQSAVALNWYSVDGLNTKPAYAPGKCCLFVFLALQPIMVVFSQYGSGL